MLRSVTFFALVAYVAAQNVSPGCSSTLSGLLVNPDVGACLNPAGLVSVFSSGSNTSIVPAFSNWANGICGAPACTNATIEAVIANITSGCQSDLATFGISQTDVGGITQVVTQVYPTVRKVLCLKRGDQLCVTEALNDIESIVGPLSIGNIVRLASGGLASQANLLQNATLVCTDCTKAAYNVIAQDFPRVTQGDQEALSQTCGAAFIDGQNPSSVTQSASTAVASPASRLGAGAMATGPLLGLTAIAVAGVSAAFTLMA